ncbi:unnamed protein product [Closterium sp. Naga37s-1]|nr:unnamed protein product [Closterium sp. Naga37s-1]CAI5532580.1 unnamed protein product [Closterium sp. Naga37s-1]
MGPTNQLVQPVEQDPRAERTREESDEEDEQEYGDEPAYDDRQGYGGGRAHGDEPEYGDEQGREDGQEYGGEQERGDEPDYGGEQEHGDEPEYGGEREHGDEQEDGDPQQEGDDLAPVGPHVPSGAVEGERAPSAEHVDTAAATEEEEGEAREEGARAADSERLERRYAPDALQQEVRTCEGGARTMQSRGMRGRSGAEDRRTTGIPRRRTETRDGSSRSPREPPPRADRYGGAAGKRGGVEENVVRSAAPPRAPGGSRGREHRSPETQRHWEGRREEGSRSLHERQQWGPGHRGVSRSPDRRRWREGRREEADRTQPGARQQGKGREEWSPTPARHQPREAGAARGAGGKGRGSVGPVRGDARRAAGEQGQDRQLGARG